MNEVKKIHIGRQAFTIAVDAYGDLKKYLDALTQAIADTEVIEEIELRMVELLQEKKVTQDTVILKSDVAFLKQTLGEPSDFTEDETADARAEPDTAQLPRRFMRNPRGQILGGVANGFASYFGLDPLWFRIGFVALTFASGFGILLYLILWAIMPEAKTSSDYIQMQGKPVTVESITEFAESKEVEAGIHRLGTFVASMIRLLLRAVLYAVGIGLTTVGVLGVLGSIAGAVFLIGYNSTLFSGVAVFPVSGLEIAAVIAGAIAGVAASLFMLFSGMGIFAKKWQLPSWATASLLTLFFVSIFMAMPLVGSSMGRVSKRVDNAYVTSTKQVDQFTKIDVKTTATMGIDVVFEPSEQYSVAVKTFGKQDTSFLKTVVVDGVLSLNTEALTEREYCSFLCLYAPSREIIIRGPGFGSVSLDGPVNFRVDDRLEQAALEATVKNDATFSMNYAYPQKATYKSRDSKLLLEGLQGGVFESDRISFNSFRNNPLYLRRVDRVEVVGLPEAGCSGWSNVVTVGERPKQALLNGVDVDVASFSSESAPSSADNGSEGSQPALQNCIIIDSPAY